MPRRAGQPGRPADHVVGTFPSRRLRRGAPPGTAEMVAVVAGLRRHLEETDDTISGVAERSGVNRTSIHDLLAGTVFIDVVTLARIEHAVGTRLWPDSLDDTAPK